MAKLLWAVMAIVISCCWAASVPSSLPSQQMDTVNVTEPSSLATNLSSWLVDHLSRKLVAFYHHFNLKLRIVRFFVSLYTTENLLLMRSMIEHAINVGNTVLRYLPKSTVGPASTLLGAFSNLLNTQQNFGSGGLFGQVLGSPSYEEDTTHAMVMVEEEEEKEPELVLRQSKRDGTTEDTNGRAVFGGKTRSLSEVSGEDDRTNELIARYEDRLKSLEGLINAGTRDD